MGGRHPRREELSPREGPSNPRGPSLKPVACLFGEHRERAALGLELELELEQQFFQLLPQAPPGSTLQWTSFKPWGMGGACS